MRPLEGEKSTMVAFRQKGGERARGAYAEAGPFDRLRVQGQRRAREDLTTSASRVATSLAVS
jgi:hypothetical protein